MATILSICAFALPTTGLALERCLPVTGSLERNWPSFWAEWSPGAVAPTCAMVGGLPDCLWTFDLADPRAVEIYALLRDTLTGCLQVDWEDLGVNHPDAYQAVGATLDVYTVSASFKRKTALAQTRVVFRITARD